MSLKQTIPNSLPTTPGKNISFLKEKALELIQSYASETWTDHNEHDPGITILENLCYAITDLSYRLDFPITDLLSQKNIQEQICLYWTADQILPSSPVTVADYRRLIIDIPEVKNAWLKPQKIGEQITGIWNIHIEKSAWVKTLDEQKKLIRSVRDRVLSNRNIGEDIHLIRILAEQFIQLKLKINIQHGVSVEETLVDLLIEIENIVSPATTSQDYQDLQNLSGEEIYDGPLLRNGVIQNSHLSDDKPSEKIFASDIISVIKNNMGVKSLDFFQFGLVYDNNILWEDWILELMDECSVVLDILNTLEFTKVYKNGHQIAINKNKVLNHLNAKKQKAENQQFDDSGSSGYYRHLDDYISIQHEFPASYGIGAQGVAENELSERKNEIKQLQGYLLLFDQVLANHFSQLEMIRHLLSLPDARYFQKIAGTFSCLLASEPLNDNDIAWFWCAIRQLPQTLLSQKVNDINHLKELLGDFYSEYQHNAFNHLNEKNFSDLHLDRLKRNYEHLLSRFHEQANDPGIMKYREVISYYLDDLLKHKCAPKDLSKDQLLDRLVILKLIVDMVLNLSEYPQISRDRARASHYLSPTIWGNENVAGIKRRLYRLLGIPDVSNDPLTVNNCEGVHVLEGMLLRYRLDELTSEASQDLSKCYLVMPDWPSRFSDSDFQQVIVSTVSNEIPVHLNPVIVWLDRKMMDMFERVYNAWLNVMTQLPANYRLPLHERIDELQKKRDEKTMERIRRFSELLFKICEGDDEVDIESIYTAYAINGDESYIGSTYRIGYPQLEHLKEIRPLINTRINSEEIDVDGTVKKTAFTVAISKPHVV